MSNWYSKININLKNNKDKTNVNKILDFLKQKYDFNLSEMQILDNKLEFYGDNGNTIVRKDKPGYLPDAEELFIGICLAVKECDIEASVIYESSVEDGFNEYKLNFQKNRINISISPWVWEVPFYDYESYDDFCVDYDDEITEEEFYEAIENDYIYQDEEFNFYSEESLKENFQTLIDITIDELTGENPNKNKLLKIISNCASILQFVNPKLQNDKDILKNSK